jgi:hypothetical protein
MVIVIRTSLGTKKKRKKSRVTDNLGFTGFPKACVTGVLQPRGRRTPGTPGPQLADAPLRPRITARPDVPRLCSEPHSS